MNNRLRVEGLYDSRTLKFLKGLGINQFTFDFNPRSFNFIQEYVFVEQLIPLLSTHDLITISFPRSNDPMIIKVLGDLKKYGFDLKNVRLDCSEWPVSAHEMNVPYYLNYTPQLDMTAVKSQNFKGFIFDYSLFEGMKSEGVLRAFASNYYTRFGVIASNVETILKVHWRDNIFPSLVDLFDFNTLSLPINTDIEVCYRNVDLKKLQKEMDVHVLKKEFNERLDF